MAAQPVLGVEDAGSKTTSVGETVLDVLGSERCRSILDALCGERLTADELAERVGMPISTVYRHLATLADADLVSESIRIDLGGRNRREYSPVASGITVSFDGGVEVHLLDADAEASVVAD